MISCIQQVTFWEILTSIGTVAMAIVSAITLFQLYQSAQAKLFVTISVHTSISNKQKKKKFWCLDISNIGQRTAYNIRLDMDKSFVKSLPIKSERKILKDLMVRTFIINPQETKIYPLCPVSVGEDDYTDYYKVGEYKEIVDSWLEYNYNKPFNVKLKYNNKWFWNRYSFTLQDYDTRGAIFNENEKIIKVELMNGKNQKEKP